MIPSVPCWSLRQETRPRHARHTTVVAGQKSKGTLQCKIDPESTEPPACLAWHGHTAGNTVRLSPLIFYPKSTKKSRPADILILPIYCLFLSMPAFLCTPDWIQR